jgi:hypothetical protein
VVLKIQNNRKVAHSAILVDTSSAYLVALVYSVQYPTSITMAASNGTLPSTPISIPVSKAEIESGKLSQRNLEIATRALVRDGLVVLEDLISHDGLDKLNKKVRTSTPPNSGPFGYRDREMGKID